VAKNKFDGEGEMVKKAQDAIVSEDTKPEGAITQTDLAASFSALTDAVNKQNKAFTRWETIKRGMINGVATAVGATLGFAILLLLLARLIQGATLIPALDKILDDTGLKRIIEYQLKQIEVKEDDPTPIAPTSTPQPTPLPEPSPTVTPTAAPTKDPQPTDTV
jgi:hypothetical protein